MSTVEVAEFLADLIIPLSSTSLLFSNYSPDSPEFPFPNSQLFLWLFEKLMIFTSFLSSFGTLLILNLSFPADLSLNNDESLFILPELS
jgi:hypothetical protein